MASPGGVQAGRLAPGLENPILEAGQNYYIFLYAPYDFPEGFKAREATQRLPRACGIYPV